jgi:hypothetical protein
MDEIFALVLEVAEATKWTGEDVVAPDVGEVTVTPANAEAPARMGRRAVRMICFSIYLLSFCSWELTGALGSAPISRSKARDASILDGLREAPNVFGILT